MTKFTVDDLYQMYDKYENVHGKMAYKYVSQILADAKPLHKKSFSGRDHEQSWRSFKGKNLEKLIVYIIKSEVNKLGLEIVNGNTLERKKEDNLSEELASVKRNLLIDYGEFGYHLPDADIVIYEPDSYKVIAILSSKVTLRERIAQSGYWKLKLSAQKLTRHIKFYFVTPDEDGVFTSKAPVKKARAIVEVDLDGSYVLSEEAIEESDRVKPFEEFIDDLMEIIS